MERMKDKVAIITGATSGIGRETALLFAKRGIKVVAAGRDEKAGHSLIDEIDALRKSNPLNAIPTAKEVAETVLWLCSPMASHVQWLNHFHRWGRLTSSD